MDKLSSSPFNPIANPRQPRSPTSNLMPNSSHNVEMNQAPSLGKRNIKELSKEEIEINPAVILSNRVLRNGNQAQYKNEVVYKGDFEEEIPNGRGVFVDNTSTYEGEVVNGYPHGQGEINYNDVRFYKGSFEKGLPHGKGVLEYFDNTSFDGDFKEGLPHGKGRITLPGGNTYDVIFKEGFLTDGHSVIVFKSDGYFYSGPQEDKQGYGIELLPSGEKKEGEVTNGKFEGRVKVYIGNNLCFEGDFEKGNPKKGTLYEYENDVMYLIYEGEVCRNFNRMGKGKLTDLINSSLYEGEFLGSGFNGTITSKNKSKVTGFFNEIFSGESNEATIVYSDGDSYNGSIKDWQPHGRGVLIYGKVAFEGNFDKGELDDEHVVIRYPSGTRYEGQMKDDLKHGYGVLSYIDGDIYEGDFVKDRREGWGKHTFKEKGVYEGLWKDDVFLIKTTPSERIMMDYDWADSGTRLTNKYEGLNDKLSGVGVIIYPNGSIYRGDVVNGLAFGKGKLVSLAGHEYEGYFLDGKFSGNGKLKYKDYSYEGDFVDGLYSGEGKESYLGKLEYNAHYMRGLKQGSGSMSFPNGLILYCQFDNGTVVPSHNQNFSLGNIKGEYSPKTPFKIDEKYLIVYSTGDYFLGKAEGTKMIEGTLYYANGNIYEGQFELFDINGRPLQHPHGQGKKIWINRGQYEGKFHLGKPKVSNPERIHSVNPYRQSKIM